MSSVKFDLRWIAAIAGTLALMLIVNPIGYMGGGMDDWQYLTAARCWAANGPCVPHDHWQGRWPIVAPLGAVIALFGDTRFIVGLPSLIFSIGCLILLASLGNRIAGRPVGYMAALLLLVAPAFAIGLLDPSVEATELFFLLCAAWCILLFTERRSYWWAAAAGLSLSMAFQVRETTIAAVPLAVLGLWVFARRDPRAWLFAAVGAAAPLLLEALVFWLWTGDPLWRRELSMAHTQIPSTELMGAIDRNHSPILNPNYIANWRREPGIHIHWLIDGLVNLFCNMNAGTTIPLSVLFFALFGRSLNQRNRAIVAWCLGIALYWACFLIYILAIDPKPRMMEVPIALTALALSVLLVDRYRQGAKLLVMVTLQIAILLPLLLNLLTPSLRHTEPVFARWQQLYPGQIEAGETMRRNLALVDGAEALPAIGSGRPMVILGMNSRCAVWAPKATGGALVAVDRAPMTIYDSFRYEKPGNICLFRYVRRMNEAQLKAAIDSENDKSPSYR